MPPTPLLDASSQVFLVERYLPSAAAGDLGGSVARASRLCAHPSSSVTYLSSAFLPAEDTCFCLFRARSPGAVLALNGEAAFPVDRITAAVLLLDPITEGRPT